MNDMTDKIHHFLNLTGFDARTAEVAKQMTEQFASGFKESFGEDPPKGAAEALALVEKTLSERKDDLKNAVADVYAKTFSESEIEALIAFYEGGLGKKLTDVGPTIEQGVIDAVGKWSVAILREINPEIEKILAA